jgi:hypothetical protein
MMFQSVVVVVVVVPEYSFDSTWMLDVGNWNTNWTLFHRG